MECARLQHRFALPPLEVQDFPQAGGSGFGDARLIMQQNTSNYLQEEPTNNNQQDIVQEILSVAQASQNFMNQDTTWGGGSYINHQQDDDDDFSFLSQNDPLMYDVKFTDKILREDQSFTMRSIQIGNMNNEEELKSADRMIENLRWVGMSDKDLEKVRSLFSLFFNCHSRKLKSIFFLKHFYICIFLNAYFLVKKWRKYVIN